MIFETTALQIQTQRPMADQSWSVDSGCDAWYYLEYKTSYFRASTW